MPQHITRIRTESGDLQIDYNALANLPQLLELDDTLSKAGDAADAKAVGDLLDTKEDKTSIDKKFNDINKEIDDALASVNDKLSDINEDITDINNRIKLQGAPYNYLVNSDFRKFVAQTGIGQPHTEKNKFYAGDRWQLVGVTNAADIKNVIGCEENNSGEGYSGIKLWGKISQIVLDEFEDNNYTCGVETSEGTATASYDRKTHTFTITSYGGTLKNAWLYKGNFTQVPDYQPKGFATELSECQKYFQVIRNGYGYASANRVDIFVPTTILTKPRFDDANKDIFIAGEGEDVKNGEVFVNGEQFTIDRILDFQRYLPNEIRIGLGVGIPNECVNHAAFLWNTRIYIDRSPEYVDYFSQSR